MSTSLEKHGATVNPPTEPERAWSSAPVDVLEGDEDYLVYADVPGVEREDLRIEYADGELRLEGMRRAAGRQPAVDYRRVFRLGRDVDLERVSAELQGGVLEVRLPKSASAKPRQIQISST